MPLTALKVRTAGPGRHADIYGLYLVVRESGSRSWVLRMQHKGCRRDFGLGPAHDLSLADARQMAAALRRMVRTGLDPVRERERRKVCTIPILEVRRRHRRTSLIWSRRLERRECPSAKLPCPPLFDEELVENHSLEIVLNEKASCA
ncbi:hypothetical protein CLG96_14225 [Sphingomonas oleivorans]|uniref:Integrase DNA-binding domain-containing protein n=1 Tax=Sphingomonas oleivorans TaxID=1735121 RepID=A0A2T5FWW2_9SPHN|nr:Arm DNA-binding domain-containing protein [Sphingomonas oleivorans]PTQ10259.1 hypothetical protein CLG96_14225 [Sphingomonas oleivorans]